MKHIAIAAALMAALSLAACGGGGGSSNAPPPVDPAELAQAEREAAEQAERERLAREEAERQERERLAQEEAEREAAERAAAMLPFPLEPWSCDPSLAHIPGACGGDASGRPHFGIWALPDADIADAKRSPISHDSDGNDRRVFVGVDQGTEHIDALPIVGSRGDADIRFGTLNDGAGKAAVDRYLSQIAPTRSTRSSRLIRCSRT